jgi:KEOPS complex subunit Cgi121
MIIGVRGPISLEDVLFISKKGNRIGTVQVVRADRVLGAAHIDSAIQHAERAWEEGRAHAKSLDVEFMRYVAGERQIRKAIEKMGIPETCDAAVIVGLGPHGTDAAHYLHDSLGAKRDDTVLEPTMDKLRGYGITDLQLSATTPGKEYDLALEAVAEVDLLRT